MKKLFICLALAASILFSGCGGKGVTTPIDPPVDQPVDPPIVTKRAWPGIIAFRDNYNYNTKDAGLYFLEYNKQISEISRNFYANDIAWNPSGQYLVGRKNASPNVSLMINRQGQEVGASVKNFDSDGGLFAWSPDGDEAVFGSYTDGIYALSTSGVQREVMQTIGFTYDHNVCFDYNGSYMYWIHHEYGNQATLYRATIAQFKAGFKFSSAELIVSFTSDNHDANIFFVPLANGTLLMSHSTKIHLIDPVAKTMTDMSSKFDYGFNQIRMSPNKQYLAVNDYEGIRILNASDFSQVKTLNLKYQDTIAWSPDSDALACGKNDTLYDSNYKFLGYESIISIGWLSDGKVETITTIKQLLAQTRDAYGDMFVSISWTR